MVRYCYSTLIRFALSINAILKGGLPFNLTESFLTFAHLFSYSFLCVVVFRVTSPKFVTSELEPPEIAS